jgi:cell division protein FtsN
MARRNRNSRRNEAAPGWVWMLFGLGLGLIVAIGVYLRSPGGSDIIETRATAAALPTISRAAPPAPTQAKEPPQQRAAGGENRFDFYEVLPQFEVVVPDDNGSAAAPVTTRPRPAAAPGSFLLQAGSFSAAADADRLKANLALLGFESHVQRVTIEDDVFNRVRIGPITDLDTAKRTQRRLRDAGIDALLMKVPN